MYCPTCSGIPFCPLCRRLSRAAMDSSMTAQPSLSVKKKRPGVWHFLRATVFMIRRVVAKKPTSVNVEKLVLNNFIVAMKPLHHNINGASATECIEKHEAVEAETGERPHGLPSLQPPPLLHHREENDDQIDDDDDELMSVDPDSRHSSAMNLVELDKSESSSPGQPNMIDLRAEEFIAKFYEQIRLQRVDCLNRYNEMIERGSG